jgi:hypothetical protein
MARQARVDDVRKTVSTLSGVNIIAGIWLFISPFILGFSGVGTALWNALIIGVAITIMALVRVTNPLQYEGVSWMNFVLGIWLVISPFILAYSWVGVALWNSIIVGAIVLVLAAISAKTTADTSREVTI